MQLNFRKNKLEKKLKLQKKLIWDAQVIIFIDIFLRLGCDFNFTIWANCSFFNFKSNY